MPPKHKRGGASAATKDASSSSAGKSKGSAKRAKSTTPTAESKGEASRPARSTRSKANPQNPGTMVTKRTRGGVAKIREETGLYKIIEKEGVHFHLMDLPAELRMRIYRYAFGLRVIHVLFWRQRTSEDAHPSFNYCVCKCGPALHPTLSEFSVGEKWEEGDTSAVPFCQYTRSHSNSYQQGFLPTEKLHLNLLRANKRVYEEAKGVLFGDNIFAFRGATGFDVFLLKSPRALIRKDLLKKLVMVVTPKGNDTHFWNLLFGQLYLPNGPMSAPDPHFPLLRAVQLHLQLSNYPWPVFDTPTKWSNLFWLWGFMYLALENLERVSVVSKDYEVQGGGDGKRFVKVGEVEQREYEEVMQERLLREWMGGDQDDVELMRREYEMKTKGMYFHDWGY